MASRARGCEIRHVPLTVAPPPRNGDAAQGRWRSGVPEPPAADAAGVPPGAPEPAPTPPAPAAIARTMAAGVLLSAAALAMAAAPVLLICALRVGSAGDVRLVFGPVSQVLVITALAVAYAGALAAPLWPWPARRLETLAFAAIATAVWPLSGAPFPVAVGVTLAVGLALTRDRLSPGGQLADWGLAGLFALAALVVALAGVVLAEARPARAPAAGPVHSTAPGGRGRTPPTGGQDAAHAKDAEPPARSGRAPSPTPEPPVRRETPSGTTEPPVDRETPSDTPEPPGRGARPGDGSAPGGSSTETTPRESPASAATPIAGNAGAPDPAGSATEASAADADEAEGFVRDYYTAIDEQRYDDAWAMLASAVRSDFGGFARWRAGYAKTQSNAPNDLSTTLRGDRTIVQLRLSALEQGCPIARDYSVTWTLERAAGEWTATSVRASADGASSCG
jgi:hypothetical protein